MKQHALRIDDDLMVAVDKRAEMVGLSRNAWIAKAIEWALKQPIKTETITQKV